MYSLFLIMVYFIDDGLYESVLAENSNALIINLMFQVFDFDFGF